MEKNRLFDNNDLFGVVDEVKEERPKVAEEVKEVVTEENTNSDEETKVINEVPVDFLDADSEIVDEEVKPKVDLVHELLEINDDSIIIVQDAKIQFKDYEGLSTSVENYLKQYQDLVIDEDGIKDAKKVVATLRKNSKAINTLRKDIKKKVLEPYNFLEDQIKGLDEKIDSVVNNIDEQVKSFELKDLENKKKEIANIYKGYCEDYPNVTKAAILPLRDIAKKEWGNKSCKLKTIEEEIATAFKNVDRDLKLISMESEISGRLLTTYKENGFDLAAAKELVMKQIVAEKEAQARVDSELKAKAMVIDNEKVEEIKKEAEEVIKQQVEEEPEDEIIEEEETLRVKFEVIGTKPNLLNVIAKLQEFVDFGLVEIKKID